MRLLLLFLSLIPCSWGLDYSLSTSGPHHVVVGHSMYFNVTGTIIVGPDENVTPSISGVPSGAAYLFPNLIKFCCTTFRFGIAGDNPVEIDVTTATPGTYPLLITYTSASNVIRSIAYSLIIDAVPGPLTRGAFPPNTALTGLAQWQANMTHFAGIYCTPPLGGPAFEGFIWYYDGPRNMFQTADYTHDTQWSACATALAALYRAYVLQTPPTWTGTAGNIPGWHVFPKGLAMDYTRNGTVASKNAIISIQTNGYANIGDVSQVISYLLSREISYGLETNLEAEGLGVARIADFNEVVDVLFGQFDQWFQSQSAVYTQPFMVALACEALIQYWDATGDARVPPMIKLAADMLWSVSWDSSTNSFFYYNNFGGPSSPIDPNCTNGVTTPCKVGSPDLNMLIVPLFGWVYQRTADITYRNRGDQIFNNGAASAFLGDGKHDSQNYRWSDKYVQWRDTGGSVTINGAVLK